MEFRYRANDRDRPPPPMVTAPSQFPNPNSSLMPGSSDIHVREAIQREIEKELIRQEIVIAEAARKRELLGEVLQEMAMEKEMAKRNLTGMGISLEEKLNMLINNQMKVPNHIQSHNNIFRHIDPLINIGSYNSPLVNIGSYNSPLVNIGSYNSLVSSSSIMQMPPLHQTREATRTSVMEPNKERLIVLERADSVGEKRKAENTRTGLERAKRRASNGVGVGFSSVSTQLLGSVVGGLNEDLHRNKNSAEVSTLKEKPMSSKDEEIEGKRKSCFKFWCDICKVGAYSPRVMTNHELGEKRMAALTQQNEPPETDSTSEVITVSKNGQKKVSFWCKTCNIQTNSEQMMESHKAGKKHKAIVEHKLRKL